MSFTQALAKTVSPYSLDFDDVMETADHSFAPVGWGHIVDNFTGYGSTEWVQYKWDASAGIDDSGALYIGTQQLEIDDDDDETHYKSCNDMLVTPSITGTSSIWVKKGKSGSGSIYFYIVTEENGKLKAGSMISVTVPTLNASNYVQVNIPQQADGSRIGIEGSNVYIDNFSAASAEIDQKTEIKVSAVNSNMPKNFDADENGKFNVAFKVNVRNTGNVDIAKGTENFSISLVNATLNDSVMSTVDIPQDLAAGELSADIEISASMDVNLFPGEYLYKIRENLSGSSIDALKFKITPHKPTIALLNAEGKKEFADGATLDYGINKKEATGTFVLKNDGGSDLNISAITIPEGYVINKTEGFTVAPHDTAKIVMTMTNFVAGKKDGTLAIKSNAGDKVFVVKGETADDETYFVDFENGIPANCYNIGSWSTDSYPADLGMIGNTKAAYGYWYSGDAKRLVTPLLDVKEGETMRFIAARKDNSASLGILYSTDRKNWTSVRTLSTSAENEADMLPEGVAVDGTWSKKYDYKEYTIDNIPAGKYYIAFDNKSVYVDNIYGFHKVPTDHDVLFTSVSVKNVGTVNTAMTARAKLLSLRDDAEEIDGYSLGLYIDGKLEGLAKTVKLVQNKEAELSINFTPHVAGTHDVAFKFISGDYVVESASTEITIAAESSEMEKTVGNRTDFSYSDGPLYTYETASETELLYKAEDIDLPVGAKITKIAFKGYISYGELDANVRAYMESTEQKKFETNTIDADSTAMTKIFDGVVHFEESGSQAEPVNQLEFTFNEPLVYDGKGLHFLLVHSAEKYKSVYYEVDGSITDQGKHSYKEFGSAKSVYTKLPVACFSVAIESHTLSGKVTDKTTGSAIEGAKVILSNNDVEYSATTDAEGKYSMTVYKFDRKYNVSVKKIGYYLEQMDEANVSELANTLDIAMSEAKHLVVANAVVPTSAMVNHKYQMSVDVFNYMATDKKSTDYSVTLKDNDDEVAKAVTVDIAAGEKATILLNYTPHVAGTAKLVAEMIADNETFATEQTDVTISEEVANTVKQVGDALSEAKDAPVNSYWKHSETQAIYPAKMLNLKKGMKITRIAYKGWTPGNIDMKAKIWLENTSDVNTNEMVMGDTTQMKLVYDGEIVYPDGKQVGSPTDPAEIFVIDIPEGFVYDGENIRIAGRSDVLNNSTAAFNFVVDNNVNNTTYARNSDSDIDSRSWSRVYNTSVLYLDVEFKYNLSGTVTNSKSKEPVADAIVTMESDDVIYATTTGIDGGYSMDILQPSLNYTLTVSADNYLDFKKENVKSETDTVIDAELEPETVDYIGGTCFSSDTDVSVYTLDGTFVAKGKNVIGKLVNGSYIIKDNATGVTKKLVKR